LNLLLNAIHVSPPGAKVRFISAIEGECLLLEVHDEGPGFGPEARAVLAGDSNRPAPIGEGAGLGLWVTRRLLQDIGGQAAIVTSPLGGALVRVTIPLGTREELRDVA
jgi:signal transduction histidine kinase